MGGFFLVRKEKKLKVLYTLLQTVAFFCKHLQCHCHFINRSCFVNINLYNVDVGKKKKREYNLWKVHKVHKMRLCAYLYRCS